MTNLSKLKKQAPLRFFEDDWKKIKAKTTVDGITYQKLGEILFKAYLNGNKEIMKIVEQYANDKKNKKKRYGLTEVEADDILSHIEKFSPLNDFDQALEELKDEK